MNQLPRPVCARVKSLPEGSLKAMHSHSWVQLSYAIKGVLEVRAGNATYLAPPQRAVWIPPEVEHEVVTSVHTEMRNMFIDQNRLEFCPEGCRVLEVSPFVRELIRVIAALPLEYDESGPDGRLVQVFLDQVVLLPEVEFSLPMPVNAKLLAVCGQLRREPDEHKPMAEIAKEAGMSERTMARVFLRETGLSFRDWRVRLRLLMSLESLEESRSVTKAALDCGYDSSSAFITAFKRHFGRTPGDFFKKLGG